MIENEQINPLEIKTEISAFMNAFRDEIDFQPLKIILESKWCLSVYLIIL